MCMVNVQCAGRKLSVQSDGEEQKAGRVSADQPLDGQHVNKRLEKNKEK